MIEPYRTEVDPPLLPLRRGSTGPGVQRVQEWLSLHGIGVQIDGDFGPATEAAVRRFTGSPLGVVDREIWRALTMPLQQVATMSVPAGFGAAVVALGMAYLNAQAREVGGDNKGPWVRHVCRGFSVAWCQGFASTLYAQAGRALGEESPLDLVLDGIWCLYVPRMVTEARVKGRFVRGDDGRADPPPGSMFFLRGGAHGYSHVGIVVRRQGDVIETVEGNTNDDGSPNGYEVARRFRRVASCDYGVLR